MWVLALCDAKLSYIYGSMVAFIFLPIFGSFCSIGIFRRLSNSLLAKSAMLVYIIVNNISLCVTVLGRKEWSALLANCIPEILTHTALCVNFKVMKSCSVICKPRRVY